MHSRQLFLVPQIPIHSTNTGSGDGTQARFCFPANGRYCWPRRKRSNDPRACFQGSQAKEYNCPHHIPDTGGGCSGLTPWRPDGGHGLHGYAYYSAACKCGFLRLARGPVWTIHRDSPVVIDRHANAAFVQHGLESSPSLSRSPGWSDGMSPPTLPLGIL